MPYRDTAWTALEQWAPTAFLAAGGLFVLPTLVSGVEAATGTGIDVSPAVIFLFLLVVFVALLGLYPGLAERDSALANGSLGLLGATAAILVSTLAISALPVGPTVGKSTALASIVIVAVGSVLTVTAFGVASLRTGAHPRPVGGFLLATGAAMSLMIVAMLRSGHTVPAWVSFGVNGLVATSLGASGYALRSVDGPDAAKSTGDAATS